MKKGSRWSGLPWNGMRWWRGFTFGEGLVGVFSSVDEVDERLGPVDAFDEFGSGGEQD